MNVTNLAISWGVSKGRDTYGYNICRLDDTSTRKRYRCMGGGYDMVGTVFGEWLADVHQGALQRLADRYETTGSDLPYGMRRARLSQGIQLDGACGVECMIRIAKEIGQEVQRTWDRRGNTTGYLVGAP